MREYNLHASNRAVTLSVLPFGTRWKSRSVEITSSYLPRRLTRLFQGILRLGSIAGLALACAQPLSSQQTTADVLGTIRDPSGAGVPAARLTLENLATHETRNAQTNAEGDYIFNLVPIGHYSVLIEARLFKAFQVTDLAVSAGDRARVDAQLQIGPKTETVVVSAQPAPLQTDSSSIGSTITEKSVQDLPLKGRNFIDLVQLAPGVNAGPPNSIGGGNRPDDRRLSSAFSANGQGELLNNFLVDGLDNNESEQGFDGFRPPIDAIAEVRVVTNDYSAEVGRAAGSVVSLITKSGTNQLHGSLYEYFRNDILDARDAFALTKPEYRQNQFGGSIGGPIVRNRTFFFADIEELRIVQGQTQTVTVPTLYEEQHPGDFSDTGGPVIPASGLNATSLNYFKLYPTPNRPGTINNYTSSAAKTQFSTAVDARVDRRFNDRNLFFARYGFNPVSTFIPGALPPVSIFGTEVDPGGLPFAFAGPSKTSSQNVQLNYVRILNPNLMVELNAGYTRINIHSLPLNYGTNLASKFGVVNGNLGDPVTSALPVMWFAAGDYATVGDGMFVPILDTNNTFQYNGAVTLTRGGHNIKTGAALIRRQLNYYQSSWSAQGGFIFLPGAPYNQSMANFLTGSAPDFERGYLLIHPGYRTWEPSIYLQDDWHAKRWLTLNLGLRYEIFTPTKEAHNRYSNFDMASLSVVQASGGNPTANVNTDYRNVAPRFGFAATLPHGMVLRGGFGISYFSSDYQSVIQNANPPYNYYCFFCATSSFPELPLPTESSITNPVGTVTVKPQNFRSAYIEQFNLMLQRALGANVLTIGYVGELGRRLLYQGDLDRPLPPGPGNATPPFVYAAQLPNVTSITINDNAATSSYHALQTSLDRRFGRGLTLNANYTFARGLTDGINKSGSSSPLDLIVNDRHYDWGNSELDVRHRFALSANYELVFGKVLNGLPGALMKGWQINTIAFWQTGLPFTVVDPVPRINLPGVGSDRPDVVPGQSLTVPNPSIVQWFNTAAFTPQTLGTPGNEGRNQLYGPHVRRVDLSLFKEFMVQERLRLQFRAECYNVSNTPSFSQPNNSLGTAGFGTISSALPTVGPRSFQFELKLAW